MRKPQSFLNAKVFAVLALSAAGALGQTTLYWDANGSLGGNGTWDVNTTQNWSTVNTAGAPNSKWTPNDGTVNAVFNGSTAYTVTIPSGTTIDANSITLGVSASNTTITGGTALDIASPTASFVMNTNKSGSARAQIIASPIGGTDITVVANAGTVNSFLTLGANTASPTSANQNTFTGNLIFAGSGTPTSSTFSQININNALALPSTASVLMDRDFCQLLFTAAGASGTTAYSATFNNPINLNATGSGSFSSGIGSSNTGSVITLGGQITGTADLYFRVGLSGGNGTIVLTNPNNNWTGNTFVAMASGTAGAIKLGVNNGLPQTTTLSLGAASATGNFDMAGFNQTISGLSSNNSSSASVLNSSSNPSTLTINGNVVNSYFGILGPGTNNHIALNLPATNTGSLTLGGVSNAYDGGTTVNGGTLLVANASGSATGSGAVTVGASGKLGSGATGFISGHVDNSGTLLPGGTGAVGTLNLNGGLTAEAGSSMNFDWGTSGTSVAIDKIALGGASDSTILSTPGGAGSVNVKLFDPGSEIRNQTYTLMTYPGTTTLSSLDTSVFNVIAPTQGIAQGADFSITNNTASHEIDLTVSNIANFITWTGDANGNGTWDVATTPNWAIGGVPGNTFHTYDNVTFDDTANAASGNGTISVTIPAGGVIPSQTTFNNTVRNYVVTGGPIAGSGALIKSGGGFLTIDGPNTYTGGTFINGGTLNTSEDSGLGAAGTPVALNGGTLQLGLSFNPTGRPFSVGVNGGTVDTNGFNTTIDGALTGTAPGTFTKQGAGTLVLTNAANTFSGATVITNGTLSIASPYTTTTGITINAPGTLQLAANVGGTAINSATLVMNAGSTLDITNNTVTFSTTVNGHDANTLLAALKSAYDSGSWDHPGITSSLAAISHGATSVGWNSNTGANTFTVRYTLPGDTNLDGVVNSTDLGNISPTGTTWATGDFNYDGLVNADDIALYMLGAAYGNISAAPAPEPTGAALLAVSAGIAFMRRRRNR